MIRSIITNIILLFLCNAAIAQYKIEVLDSNTFTLGDGVALSKTSFRGLSVVDDQIIWVSGSKGTIAKSLDAGKTFEFTQIKGYEKSDFRDIEAFDDKRAIIMSSGTPAYILKTIDGGQTWKEVYKNLDTAYFLDAMDFWDEKRGILVGDPIHGHFVLLQTKDAGETWQELDTNHTPTAMEGEAVFAASGTSLRCWGKNEFGFVTGGTTSNFHSTKNYKKQSWSNFHIPILSGKSSQGTFSFTKSKPGMCLFAGGDYLNDTQTTYADFFYTNSFEENQINSIYIKENFNGYKSSIEILFDNKKLLAGPIIISTGTSGTQISRRIFREYSIGYVYQHRNFSEPFNVVRKAKMGNGVFLAGGKGKIGRLLY